MFFGKIRFGIFFNESRPRISLTSIDAKELIDLDAKYYLYEIENGDYPQVNAVEWISLEPVKVLSVQEFTAREVLKSYDVYVPQKWEIE